MPSQAVSDVLQNTVKTCPCSPVGPLGVIWVQSQVLSAWLTSSPVIVLKCIDRWGSFCQIFTNALFREVCGETVQNMLPLWWTVCGLIKAWDSTVMVCSISFWTSFLLMRISDFNLYLYKKKKNAVLDHVSLCSFPDRPATVCKAWTSTLCNNLIDWTRFIGGENKVLHQNEIVVYQNKRATKLFTRRKHLLKSLQWGKPISDI